MSSFVGMQHDHILVLTIIFIELWLVECDQQTLFLMGCIKIFLVAN